METMKRWQWAFLLAGILVFGGCIGASNRPPDKTSDVDGNQTKAGSSSDSNSTTPRDWSSAENTPVRPGSTLGQGEDEIGRERTYCTTNFIFRDPQNARLFVGTAAHCVEGVEPGEPIELAEGRVDGVLSYSGWWDEANGTTDSSHGYDFALVAIPKAHWEQVHPSLKGWEGPVGLAQPDELATGDMLHWFGNSSDRQDVDHLQRNRGVFCEDAALETPTHLFFFRGLGPAIPGDSGSPVVTADGEALGVLVGASAGPCPGAVAPERAVALKAALDQAAQRGMNVELVTDPGET